MEQCKAFPGVGLGHPPNWKEAKGQKSEELSKMQVEIPFSKRPFRVYTHSCSQVFKITFPETKDNHCLALNVGRVIQQTILTPCVKKEDISKQ